MKLYFLFLLIVTCSDLIAEEFDTSLKIHSDSHEMTAIEDLEELKKLESPEDYPFPKEIKASMIITDCGNSACVVVSYINDYDHHLCVAESYFPYDGHLSDNIFLITSLETGEKANFRLIEPFIIRSNKYAKLVRLMPPGSSIDTILRLSDAYEINENEKYRVEFSAHAYFCAKYESQSLRDFFWMRGAVEGVLKTN